MDNLIRKQDVLDTLGEPHPLDYNAISVLQRINDLPVVDAVVVNHGRWIPSPYLDGMFKCSECGDEWGASAKMIPMMYCPSCGAKMDRSWIK